jgi:hypothetical protein
MLEVMKTKRSGIILLVVVSTLLIPSCKKKSEDPQPEETTETPVTPVTSGTFTAKINGSAKTFGTNFYAVSGGVGTVITGTETGGTSITLGFFSTTTGTYDVDGTLTQAYYYVGSTQHTATSGKIIITKVDNNTISGTFYFEEAGGVKLAEGVFTDVPKK